MDNKTQHKIEDAKLQNAILKQIHDDYNKEQLEGIRVNKKRDILVTSVLKESNCLKKLRWEIGTQDKNDYCEECEKYISFPSSMSYLVCGIDMDTTLTSFKIGDKLPKDIKAIISPDANKSITLNEEDSLRGRITLSYNEQFDSIEIIFSSYRDREECSLEWALKFAQEYGLKIINKSLDSWHKDFIKEALGILIRIDEEFYNYNSSFPQKKIKR